MALSEATRALLDELRSETALSGGSNDLSYIRTVYDRVFSSAPPSQEGRLIETWDIVDTPRGPLPVLVLENTENSSTAPVLIFIHGGGWALGSASGYRDVGAAFASAAGVKVIIPDYPLAPECVFPAAYEALVALIKSLSVTTTTPILLAGDSAGGTLCATLCSDEAINPFISAQLLYYPVLDLRPDASYPSRDRFGGGEFFLSKDGIEKAIESYCGHLDDRSDPRLSPINGQPICGTIPTFLFLPQYDPLIDEGLVYRDLLMSAGAKIETIISSGGIHGCISFAGRLSEGAEGLARGSDFINRIILGELPEEN